MPYAGRLPALHRGRPIIIVGFDATHALCVEEGRLRYVEHAEIEVSWQGDDSALLWTEFGGQYAEDIVAPADAGGDDPDLAEQSEPDGSGDARE